MGWRGPQMLTTRQRTQQQSQTKDRARRPLEENVRTWEIECGSEVQGVYRERHSLSWGRRVVSTYIVGPRFTFGCTPPGQSPRLAKAGSLVKARSVKGQGRQWASPCGSKSGRASMLDAAERSLDARGTEGEQSSEHLFGDLTSKSDGHPAANADGYPGRQHQ